MHPVLELIIERTKQGSRPGVREDAYKLGLAIEGGGMRGVVSAGMVSALEQLGLLNAFDIVCGTSAGAINGAYFVARQAAYGTTIYYDCINNDRFISFRRTFSSDPVMSLEFLLYHVMVRERVLDWKAVVSSPIPLKVVVSSLNHLSAVVLDGFHSRDELLEAFRATARIPLIAGPPVQSNGDQFLDGGIYESFPFQTAIDNGCTHVLTLLTRPAGKLRCKPSSFDKSVVARALARVNPGIARAYLMRPAKYCADVKRLEIESEHPSGPPYLFAVRPPETTPEVARLEKGRDKLLAGAASGMRAILSALSGSDASMIEVLRPFDESGRERKLL